MEKEICDIEIEEEAGEVIATYRPFSSNSSADKGELYAELEMANHAEGIVSDALTIRQFVLEA